MKENIACIDNFAINCQFTKRTVLCTPQSSQLRTFLVPLEDTKTRTPPPGSVPNRAWPISWQEDGPHLLPVYGMAGNCTSAEYGTGRKNSLASFSH